MTAVLLAFVGVIGTLAGAAVTHFFELQTWKRQQAASTAARRMDLRREAMADFTGAMFDYRRLQLHNWHQMHRLRVDDESTDVAPEVRDVRAQAWARYSRLRLVWEDEELVSRAEALLAEGASLIKASDREDLRDRGDRLRASLTVLMDSAREVLAETEDESPARRTR